jgi:hypothetical protein
MAVVDSMCCAERRDLERSSTEDESAQQRTRVATQWGGQNDRGLDEGRPPDADVWCAPNRVEESVGVGFRHGDRHDVHAVSPAIGEACPGWLLYPRSRKTPAAAGEHLPPAHQHERPQRNPDSEAV